MSGWDTYLVKWFLARIITWECRQQTRNPKELWSLCNQAKLHLRPSWLSSGKRESISSYSAANQSSESPRLATEDCISYVHEEEEETAGAWDGVLLGVRKSFVKQRQLVLLHYGMAEQYSRFLMRQIFVLLVLIDIKSWITCRKLPQVGYFGLIAVWTSRHYILIACLPREVDLGGEVDSWHNIWTLEPGNERQLLDLILNIALDQIPLCAACPATAMSLVGVERQEVEDTGKELLWGRESPLFKLWYFHFSQ